MWLILAEMSKNEWGNLGIYTERTVPGLSTLLNYEQRTKFSQCLMKKDMATALRGT